MEFDWVFVNPFHLSGFSASLYSIKDYYAMNPRLVDPAAGPPEARLRRMIETARELGLKVMMDLVINHTGVDSPLVVEHPSWYKRGPGGTPVHPGAQEGERRVTWGDLFEIDNSSDRDGLWRYWVNLAEYYAAMGVAGFRCDAAYKVPSQLWRTLIGSVKRAHPHALFFAESLGCPFEDTVRLAQSGFDFICERREMCQCMTVFIAKLHSFGTGGPVGFCAAPGLIGRRPHRTSLGTLNADRFQRPP